MRAGDVVETPRVRLVPTIIDTTSTIVCLFESTS